MTRQEKFDAGEGEPGWPVRMDNGEICCLTAGKPRAHATSPTFCPETLRYLVNSSSVVFYVGLEGLTMLDPLEWYDEPIVESFRTPTSSNLNSLSKLNGGHLEASMRGGRYRYKDGGIVWNEVQTAITHGESAGKLFRALVVTLWARSHTAKLNTSTGKWVVLLDEK